jgi:hypothetical protein
VPFNILLTEHRDTDPEVDARMLHTLGQIESNGLVTPSLVCGWPRWSISVSSSHKVKSCTE